MNRPRKFISYLLLTVVAIGAAGCKGKVWSKEEEIRIGKDAAARLESEVPVSKNPADNTLVEKIGQKLAVTNELKWPFTFKVLEMKEVNAFSLPGGPVYVTRGLLDLTEGDEDELASVIGHEMAHTDKRHVNQMYTQGMAADILIVIATRVQYPTRLESSACSANSGSAATTNTRRIAGEFATPTKPATTRTP